jgi:hypothetical protein
MQRRTSGRAIGIGLAACLCLVVWALPASAQEPAYGTAAEELAGKIAAAFPVVSGRVIGVERERILLDLGAKDKVIPGLELQVYREGQEFKHPYTGQILGKLDRDVGRVRIMEVHPNFCVAEIIQQSEGTLVQQGDSVRVTSARIVLALPNVDVADVSGTNTRSVTRDLTNALIKTNRFEVLADQRIRAALAEEKMPATDQWGDPAVLQALWKRLRVSAVLFAKLSLLEKMVRWDVQVLSTVRGDTVTLASAEVTGVAPKFAGGSGRPAGPGGSREVARIDMVATRTQELPFRGQAMAAGELTGDGTIKLAMSDGQNIYIYELVKNSIKLLVTLPGQTTDNVIWLEAADINGNGVAEIFVTNYTLGGRLRSYVLEYQGGKFVRTSENVSLHFRLLQGPDGKPELYAQADGNREPFGGPVRRYSWQGNRYAPAASTALGLPKPFPNIHSFGLADLDGDGAPKILVLDQQDYLRIYDRGGGEIYRSSDRFGGSELVLEYDPTKDPSAGHTGSTGIQPLQIMVQPRMLFEDVTGEGKRHLIVPRNVPSTGYLFKTRLYDKGKVFGLAWDGVGLQEVWQTRELPGYVADYALVDPEGTGDKKLVLLVIQTNLLGMTKSRSGLVILDMKRQG